MRTVSLEVFRFDPEADREGRYQRFEVPWEPGATVLQALLHIRQQQDPTLAFRYGCRFRNCGLCGVQVDGRPRLACIARLRDGIRVSPLRGFPVIRDLVVDRSEPFRRLAELQAWPTPGDRELQQVQQPPQLLRLLGCRECLLCTAACPHWGEEGFGGPYVFLRLAQLHLDVRDEVDRREQARRLGIERCRGCARCFCPFGIPIYRYAIRTLLDGA